MKYKQFIKKYPKHDPGPKHLRVIDEWMREFIDSLIAYVEHESGSQSYSKPAREALSMETNTTDMYGRPITVSVCCADFARALESGTDNEGCGALISIGINNRWKIGCGELDDIKFCPWCGRRVKQP